MMPAGGRRGPRRTSSRPWPRSATRCSCDDEIGRADRAGAPRTSTAAEPADPSEPSIDADLVRVVSRDWEKARRVPSELRAEMARAESVGEQRLGGGQEGVRLLDPAAPPASGTSSSPAATPTATRASRASSHPYDPLLDEYEPRDGAPRQMRVGARPSCARGWCRSCRMRPRDGAGADTADAFRGEFPEAAQRELIAEMIGEMPFPEGGWRIDPTDHPFAITIGRGDVRLTTRYDEDNLGHGAVQLHARGRPRPLRGRPVIPRWSGRRSRSRARSGLHESQSRLWENWVARGRALPRSTSSQCCSERFPECIRRGRGRAAPPGRQPRRALADPDRGRRGHLQPPHPDPLRARAGDLRRGAGARRTCPRPGTRATATTSGSRSPTTPAACSRTCTGRAAPSATSPPTASAT